MVQQAASLPPFVGVNNETFVKEIMALRPQDTLRDHLGGIPYSQLVHNLELILTLAPWQLEGRGSDVI